MHVNTWFTRHKYSKAPIFYIGAFLNGFLAYNVHRYKKYKGEKDKLIWKVIDWAELKDGMREFEVKIYRK